MKFFLLSLLLAINACGFHLRGTENLPAWFNQVAINAPGYYPLVATLKNQLGIRLVTNTAQAQYILNIDKETTAEQITGIGASTNPRQYQLIYQMGFKLVNKAGRIILDSQTIVITRQFTVNNDRILGSNFEQNLLYNEMRKEAVQQLIYRIRSINL